MSSVARLIATLALDASHFVRGISQAKVSAQGLQGGLAGLSNQVGNLFNLARLEAVVGVLGNMARAAADAAAEVTRLSKAAGAGAEGWQVLRNAAGDAGLDTGALQAGLQKIFAAQTAALSGNRKLQEAFRSLGVSAKDLETLSTDGIFAKIAEAMAKSGQTAEVNAALLDIVGKRGTALIPVLKEVGANFDALAESQKNAASGSRIFTDEQLAAVNVFQTQWTKLKDSLSVKSVGALDALTRAFSPSFGSDIARIVGATRQLEEAERRNAAAAEAAAAKERDRAEALAEAKAAADAAVAAEDKLADARAGAAKGAAEREVASLRGRLAAEEDAWRRISEVLDRDGAQRAAQAEKVEAAREALRKAEAAQVAEAKAQAEAAESARWEAEGTYNAMAKNAEAARNRLDLLRLGLEKLQAAADAAKGTAAWKDAADEVEGQNEKIAGAYRDIAAWEGKAEKAALALASAETAAEAAAGKAEKAAAEHAEALRKDASAAAEAAGELAEYRAGQAAAAQGEEEASAAEKERAAAIERTAGAMAEGVAKSRLLLQAERLRASAAEKESRIAERKRQEEYASAREAEKAEKATLKQADAVLKLSGFLSGLKAGQLEEIAERLKTFAAAAAGLDFSGLAGLEALSGFRLPNFGKSQARDFAEAWRILAEGLSKGISVDAAGLEAVGSLLDRVQGLQAAGGAGISVKLEAPDAADLQLTLAPPVEAVFDKLAAAAARLAGLQGVVYA